MSSQNDLKPIHVSLAETSGTVENIELSLRFPSSVQRLAVSIDVTQDAQTTVAASAPLSVAPPRQDGPAALVLRHTTSGALPLLFVVAKALAGRLGDDNYTAMLSALRLAHHQVLELDANVSAVDTVCASLKGANYEGVVLVGGYDLIPAQRIDTLPAALRTALGYNAYYDGDHFYVWSDEAYGDEDQDGFPELPVSRIPDASSWDLVRTILVGTTAQSPTPLGIRNKQRPFAVSIYDQIPNSQAKPLYVSAPTTTQQMSPDVVGTHGNYYFMLHGDYNNQTAWVGEDPGAVNAFPAAVSIANIPSHIPGVAFAGCCWGGLTVRTQAVNALPNTPLRPWSPQESLALTVLAAGVQGFVGCTGSHYSPAGDAVSANAADSSALHLVFWQQIAQGVGPARALYNAKKQFSANLLAQKDTLQAYSLAIAYKMRYNFSCLGLGW